MSTHANECQQLPPLCIACAWASQDKLADAAHLANDALCFLLHILWGLPGLEDVLVGHVLEHRQKVPHKVAMLVILLAK